MATPESLIFDDISLTDDTDGDNTSSLGGSERTIGNWTIRLFDENGNVGSPDTEFLDVISDPEESVLVDSTDYGLRVLGTFGTVAAAEFAATDGEKFWRPPPSPVIVPWKIANFPLSRSTAMR